jgi:predicted Holliday junction resolvase-like endonuclease
VQDNTQLLLLTEQLGSSQQQVKFLDATINTLSHQVAKLETDLENTQAEAKKQKGRAASAHTSKGQILEKWAPFVDHPEIDPNWEAENWSFMGNPIDYIVWDYRKDKNLNLEEGMIYIMDVKSAKAQLSTKQRRIRDLVKAGRVEWREIRLD